VDRHHETTNPGVCIMAEFCTRPLLPVPAR
jgi:hypothetical protein